MNIPVTTLRGEEAHYFRWSIPKMAKGWVSGDIVDGITRLEVLDNDWGF